MDIHNGEPFLKHKKVSLLYKIKSRILDLTYDLQLYILNQLIQFDKKYLNYKFDKILVERIIKVGRTVLREHIKH